MKKNYISPELEALKLAKEDILSGSDVLIDGSDLFGTGENQ